MIPSGRRVSPLFGAAATVRRARVRFSRLGPATALTHLQQIESIRRAVVAAGWPVALSGGKRPKPKVAFGPAISVGYESTAEYCDAELAGRLDLPKARADLEAKLPPGYAVVDIKSIPRFFPSLEESVNVADCELRSPLFADAREAWDRFWASSRFVVKKVKADRTEEIDARALVREWNLEGETLRLLLRFGPGRTLKPERVVQAVQGLPDEAVAVGTPSAQVRVKRTHLYLEKSDGSLSEP